jgi:RNA polymerase sigma-70 factor (ECF subfamily)
MDDQDAAAVAQVLAGDREAFRALVERHSRSIFSLAFRVTGNQADADEIVQETFLKAYKKLDGFHFQSSFRTWISRIAINCSLDMMDKRKHEAAMPMAPTEEGAAEQTIEIPSSRPGPERLAASAEIKRALASAIDSLTPIERTAFVMRHCEGCSIDEISATLNQTIGAAKNTVFRAVQKMRKSLGPFVSEIAG